MINNKMAQPVGIVLFGADCELKDEVYRNCVEQVRDLAVGYGGKGSKTLGSAEQAFLEGKNVLTVMRGEPSGDRRLRQRIVMMLRDLGAESVVGIYARAPLKSIRTLLPPIEDVEANKQITRLMQNPPTAGGLGCPLVICEEKEG